MFTTLMVLLLIIATITESALLNMIVFVCAVTSITLKLRVIAEVKKGENK